MLKGRHFLSLEGYRREEVEEILSRAAELKAEWKKGRRRQSLAGRSVALIFEKASTRTRVSFEAGIAQLGGYPLFLTGEQLQLSRGEPIKDTARVLSRYVQAVVIRAHGHEEVVEFARWSSVPVINGLTDLLHPCQILADLFTLREAGLDLDRTKIAFIGDGNNVANSWIEAGVLYRFQFHLACPPGYEPNNSLLEKARQAGAQVKVNQNPAEAAAGADVLYTDVWVSMGQEKEMADRRASFAGYQISAELVRRAAAGVKVMHCLPAHRGEEITEEVLESENSLVFEQAENRLHVQKALLELIAGE